VSVAAEEHGALVGADGVLTAVSKAWRSVPGAPLPGQEWRGEGPVFRPLAAFVRLARRRARRGESTRFPRLVVDDGAEFFRVLYVRAEPLPSGLLVLVSRADIPFGVFLGVGALAAFAFGRALLAAFSGGLTLPGSGLLPR